MAEPIGIALLGAGTVGQGVTRALEAGAERYAARVGRPLALRGVLVRDSSRPRDGVPAERLTTDLDVLLADEATHIIVELMGGEEPARSYIERALRSGRHVVTANKEVMAKHGAALLAVAAERGVRLLYEAAVGGGIPIISPLSRDLLANEITAVTAIINGTTNYMLTAMAQGGAEYDEVLAEAQRLGYAEPDPTADVEGEDAAYKLAILCGLAFHVAVPPEAVSRQGIRGLSARDFRYAQELGYAIKLLAQGRMTPDSMGGELIATVAPTLIARDEPLAKVDGVLNAVQLEGDLVGRVLLEGAGAGPLPTASAVLADVLDAARDVATGRRPPEAAPFAPARMRSPDEIVSRHYLRLTVADHAGVLAGIAGILGRHEISLASVVQSAADAQARTAEIVITTHPAAGGRLRAALESIAALEGDVLEIGSVLPIYGEEGGR
jgi:homoserine dehydrogenase